MRTWKSVQIQVDLELNGFWSSLIYNWLFELVSEIQYKKTFQFSKISSDFQLTLEFLNDLKNFRDSIEKSEFTHFMYFLIFIWTIWKLSRNFTDFRNSIKNFLNLMKFLIFTEYMLNFSKILIRKNMFHWN